MALRAFGIGSVLSVSVFAAACGIGCIVLGVGSASEFADRMQGMLRPRVDSLRDGAAVGSLRSAVQGLRESTVQLARSSGIRLWQDRGEDDPEEEMDWGIEEDAAKPAGLQGGSQADSDQSKDAKMPEGRMIEASPSAEPGTSR